MGNKIKVHELAKKIGITSKEALERANKLGIQVSSHLSGLEEADAKKLEDSFKNKNMAKKEEKQPKENKTKKEKETKEEPVIIRRQVILEESEEKNKKKNKPEKSNEVGIVEKKRKKV